MNEQDRKGDFQWLLTMIALEEERGPVVPGGAVGGTASRARRAAEGQPAVSATLRARAHVRYLAKAVDVADEENGHPDPDDKAAA